MFRDPVAASQRLLLATVVVTLAFAGPLVPGLSATGEADPTLVGPGNATLSAVSVDTADFRFSDGRFGTGVVYLRAPDATLHVDRLTGQPRIVYRLRVPALDVDRISTRVLSGPGAVTVGMDDRALRPERLARSEYRAVITVRVQSRTIDRTVFNETITLRAER